MTIHKVRKYLFVGVQEDMDVFFKKAQQKGFIEFLSEKSNFKPVYPKGVIDNFEALKILRKQPTVLNQDKKTEIDPKKTIANILHNNTKLANLQEQLRIANLEINRIAPLGDFDLKQLSLLESESNRCVQFFCASSSKRGSIKYEESMIYIATSKNIDYFISISDSKIIKKGFSEMKFQKSFGDLKLEIASLQEQISQCIIELKNYTKYKDVLGINLEQRLNKFYLENAKSMASGHIDDILFSIEAWVPENHLYKVFDLLRGLGIHAQEIKALPTERIPTSMQNKSFSKVGEDLVHIYDTPSTIDKDPSGWVFWAFSVFFAMIISDAGYGLIFLLLACYLKKKLKNIKNSGKRFIKLITVISIFCIGWGILAGAYFGIEVSPGNSINKVNIIHILAVKKAEYHLQTKDETFKELVQEFPELATYKSGEEMLLKGKKEVNGFVRYIIYDDFRDSIFMEIALIVGIIHITLSLIRVVKEHYASIGWILAMIGGYLFFPKVLDSVSIAQFGFNIPKTTCYTIGQELLIGGISFSLVAALLQHRLNGLMEFAKVIEIFADVLSYLRLYALGLAAMILADTFNHMGMQVGYVGGTFVILVGHSMNIVVGIMGGTIHGLRLNFIEWYHHSFKGGGKILNPLKLINTKGD